MCSINVLWVRLGWPISIRVHISCWLWKMLLPLQTFTNNTSKTTIHRLTHVQENPTTFPPRNAMSAPRVDLSALHLVSSPSKNGPHLVNPKHIILRITIDFTFYFLNYNHNFSKKFNWWLIFISYKTLWYYIK